LRGRAAEAHQRCAAIFRDERSNHRLASTFAPTLFGWSNYIRNVGRIAVSRLLAAQLSCSSKIWGGLAIITLGGVIDDSIICYHLFPSSSENDFAGRVRVCYVAVGFVSSE
jgi:hypothetical protein